MTHDEIAAFLMIVSCGSMSAAAEKLYISQPALSNRIKLLEEDLGYELIKRKKGSRVLELTDEGLAFMPLARKNDQMWKDAMAIPYMTAKDNLRVICISSVSDYIMPYVIPTFLRNHPEINLTFSLCHSDESYRLIENGKADIAFVSPEMYSRNVETLPAYRSAMVCVSNVRAKFPNKVNVSMLNPADEVRVTWSPEYDNWHDKHFPSTSKPYVLLDGMRSMEALLTGTRWALVPSVLAQRIKVQDINISAIESPPPDQRVFCLLRNGEMNGNIRKFIRCFNEDILSAPDTISYLDKALV